MKLHFFFLADLTVKMESQVYRCVSVGLEYKRKWHKQAEGGCAVGLLKQAFPNTSPAHSAPETEKASHPKQQHITH